MSRKITENGFFERLKWVRKDLSLTQKQFAEELDIPVSTYQHYERGESEAPVSIVSKITKYGYSLTWLFLGEGTPRGENKGGLSTTADPNNISDVEQEHMDLVKGFKDKQRALNIDKELIELEKIAPEVFERIESYIKGSVDTLKTVIEKDSKSCLDRRRRERREKDDPEEVPDGVERRSGGDRRKVS